MVRRRAQSCVVDGITKGSWSEEEDKKLAAYVRRYGHDNWRALPKLAGFERCGKSCRLRWLNYLRPDVKRWNFTGDEEELIVRLHASIGKKWSKIASYLPRRTDNEIKNVWHTKLKKRVEGSNLVSARKKKTPSRAQSSSASCSSDANGSSACHDTDELLGRVTRAQSRDRETSSDDPSSPVSCTTDRDILMGGKSEAMRRSWGVGGGAYVKMNNGHVDAMEIPCLAVDTEEVWRFLNVDECRLVAASEQAAIPVMEVDALTGDPFQISSTLESSHGDHEEQTWEWFKNIWLDYLERELDL